MICCAPQQISKTMDKLRTQKYYYTLTTLAGGLALWTVLSAIDRLLANVQIPSEETVANLLAWFAIAAGALPVLASIVASRIKSNNKGLRWALQQPFMGQLLWFGWSTIAISILLFVVRMFADASLFAICIYLAQIIFVLVVAYRFLVLLAPRADSPE